MTALTTTRTIAMFEYDFMRTAFAAGGLVAVVAGTVGYFLVLRNLTFAGHALSHVGFAGATGSVLLGIGALWGLLAFSLAAAVAMGLLGDRLRNRDVAVGIILSLALGLGVLFLYLYTTSALRLVPRLYWGLVIAILLALVETWGGIVLAYVTDWPTTFWIVSLSCLVYFLTFAKNQTVASPPPATGLVPAID